MITPGQLASVFPTVRDPGTWCRTFGLMADEFGLNTPDRLAMFLAQTGYESSSFNVLRERTSYSTVARLRAVFPHEFPTDESAVPFVLNPQGLANYVYANRNGNGDYASGDGFRFRGGGLIELTGRGNYRDVGVAMGLDLETRPIQIELQIVAARTAGFYWRQHDLNAAADHGDVDWVTRHINGAAMEGAAERRELWQKLSTLSPS